MTKKQKKNLGRIFLAVIWLALCNLLPLTGVVRTVAFLGCYVFIGYATLKKAVRGIVSGNVFNENFLMAVATIGAIALAIYAKTGDYNEAIAVMLFYQIGEWFEGYAVERSRRNISSLMDICPDYANVEKDGKLVQVSPEEISVGTEIVVQPGEKIPLDGVIIKGTSGLDTVSLTGEGLPREVGVGDEVISGCINLTGFLTVKTTKSFENSMVSKILELVENASSRKSKSENFISRFARVYTPAVCISALLLAVIPPLFGQGNWDIWIYRALSFLVISCPCALVISIPLSFFAGLGGASKTGILIKGSNYLEALARVRCVAFDKTGTLTKGEFSLTEIMSDTYQKEKLLQYGGLAESASTHPIAKSICRAYGKEPDLGRIENIQEQGGFGVIATVDGREIAVGSRRLMEKIGVPFEEYHGLGTVAYMAVDGSYAGCFVLSDRPKETSAEAVSELKKLGVQKTLILTGDNRKIAEAVAKELGIDAVYPELLPAGKVEKLEEILDVTSGTLAFVGDGINDAPVLTRADIGIAMGALGSDAAIEAADVVIMDDNPQKVGLAIRIARRCLRIVKQNIYLAIGIKFLCLVLGGIGIADMWLAIFADVGVMMLAVLNAMRALHMR